MLDDLLAVDWSLMPWEQLVNVGPDVIYQALFDQDALI